MSVDWSPGPWRVIEDENNRLAQPWTDAIGIEAPEDPAGGSIPSIVCWTTRGGPNEANAKLIALAPRMAEALAACNRYFEACARAWAVDEGRVLNAEGHTIVAAEGLDRLSDIAGELVGGVWAEIAPLTGPASDRTASNTDESKTDS